MNPEDVPLLKPTLRTTALMLVPTALFLGLISVAALAIAPASPRSDAAAAHVEGDKSTSGSTPADTDKTPARGTRASAKTPGKI